MDREIGMKLEEIRARKAVNHKAIISADASSDVQWITVNGTPIPLDDEGNLSGKVGEKIKKESKSSPRKKERTISGLSDEQVDTFYEKRAESEFPGAMELYASRHQTAASGYRSKPGSDYMVSAKAVEKLHKGVSENQFQEFMKKEWKEFCNGKNDIFRDSKSGKLYAVKYYGKSPLFWQPVIPDKEKKSK